MHNCWQWLTCSHDSGGRRPTRGASGSGWRIRGSLVRACACECRHPFTYGSGVLDCCHAVLLQARHRNPKSPELWLAAIRTEQRAASTKAAEALLTKGLQVSCPTADFGAISAFNYSEMKPHVVIKLNPRVCSSLQ